jgi:hypothetical protein
MIERRSFLKGISALFAAPAIVRAESLMPIRGIIVPIWPGETITPWPTLSEIVETTLRNRSGQIADMLLSNNALFQRLSVAA